MSTLTSLKKLYNKLTGENSKASTNSEAINEIAKADIGGGQPFVVNCLTHDWKTEECTFDTDFYTIHEKVENHEPIIIMLDDDGYQMVFDIRYYQDDYVRFVCNDETSNYVIDIGNDYTQCWMTHIVPVSFSLQKSNDQFVLIGKKLKDLSSACSDIEGIIITSYVSGTRFRFNVVEHSATSVTISRSYVENGNTMTELWKCEGPENTKFTLIGTTASGGSGPVVWEATDTRGDGSAYNVTGMTKQIVFDKCAPYGCIVLHIAATGGYVMFDMLDQPDGASAPVVLLAGRSTGSYSSLPRYRIAFYGSYASITKD